MEDDGVSPEPADGLKVARFFVGYVATAKEVAVSFAKDLSKGFVPPWVGKGLMVVLPVGDRRKVVSADGGAIEERRVDESGRRRWILLPGDSDPATTEE